MGKNARRRRDARRLAELIVDKQIRPQLKAAEMRAAGYDVDVDFVSMDPEAEGFTVSCHGCGRTAKLPYDPGAKVGLCPDCIPD